MGFELEAELVPKYCPSVSLYKWNSPRTGLQVVLIKRASPTVQGYFTVASEISDDSGCPHTLEHVVFLGSHKYPHKGVLDILGNQQLSSTNAWTMQDQTAFTLTSAGYEGFFTMLPVYLDHVLNATVTKSAFTTEVYHIDGNGDEKGVVFSEMQGHENASSSRILQAIQRNLYAPQSGYYTDTSGNIAALRKLSHERIAEYHRSVYRPENLSIVVTGDVEPEQLLSHLEEFEAALPDRDPNFKRPFVDSALSNAPSPLQATRTIEVVFPDTMESSSELSIAWLGPKVEDSVGSTAIEVVLTYLTMQDLGKLQKRFVDTKDALAADAMYSTSPYLRSQVEVSMYGVPTPQLAEAGERVLHYLEQELLNEFDFGLIRQCIETVHDEYVHSAETSWDTLIEQALADFVYGNGKTTFAEWLGSLSEIDTLRSWGPAEWQSFIRSQVCDVPKICVLARASAEEHERVEREKEELAAHIRQTEDLEQRKKELEGAVAENEQPIPPSVLAEFAEPTLANIRFIKTQTAATQRMLANLPGAPLQLDTEAQALLNSDSAAQALAIDFENAPSQFVTMKLSFTPGAVDKQFYPLLNVALNNLTSLPMRLDDGTALSADEVAQGLKRDLLSVSVGGDWTVPESAALRVVAKAENYAVAMQWVRRILFNVVFDEDKIGMFIARHLKSLSDYKRSDSYLLGSAADEVLLTDESLTRQSDALINEALVRDFEQDVPRAARDLQRMTQQLFRADNLRVLVVGNLSELASVAGGNLLGEWEQLTHRFAEASTLGSVTSPLEPILRPKDFLSSAGTNPGKTAMVVLSAALDTSSLKSVARGVTSYHHADIPALTLVTTFLGMAEGPFWTSVRGSGLAYDARASLSLQYGNVTCSLGSTPEPLAALRACANVVREYLSGKRVVTEGDLRDAVSTTVNALADLLPQPGDAAAEKFLDTVIKGYPPDFAYKIIEDSQKVTVADFLRVTEHYILPLFDPATSSLFVAAPVADEEKISSQLRSAGYTVTTREVQDDESDEDSDEEDSDEDSEEGSEEESEDESEGESEDESEESGSE